MAFNSIIGALAVLSLLSLIRGQKVGITTKVSNQRCDLISYMSNDQAKVTSHIIANIGSKRVLLFGAQMFHMDGMHLRRQLISHHVEAIFLLDAQADHYAVLGEGAPLVSFAEKTYAVEDVIKYIDLNGRRELAAAKHFYNSQMRSMSHFVSAVAPVQVANTISLTQELQIKAGISYEVFVFRNITRIARTVICMRDSKLAAVGDLVTDGMHMPVTANFDAWIDALESVKRNCGDATLILPGRGKAGPASIIDDAIQYQKRAKELFQFFESTEDFVAGLTTLFPKRNAGGDSLLRASASYLYVARSKGTSDTDAPRIVVQTPRPKQTQLQSLSTLTPNDQAEHSHGSSGGMVAQGGPVNQSGEPEQNKVVQSGTAESMHWPGQANTETTVAASAGTPPTIFTSPQFGDEYLSPATTSPQTNAVPSSLQPTTTLRWVTGIKDADANQNLTYQDGSACFPASAVVYLKSGNTVQMSELQIGDWVSSGGDSFSPVIGFTHRSSNAVSTLIRFRIEAGQSIAMSPGHYIYANDDLKAASQVKIGDILELRYGQREAVRSVELEVATGLFNPQTYSGDIDVDNFRVSTYTRAIPPTTAHRLLAPLRLLYSLVGLAPLDISPEKFVAASLLRKLLG